MQQFPPQGPMYGGGPQGPYGGHQQGPYFNSAAPGGGAYGGPYSAGPHAGPQPYGGPYSQPYQPHNNAYSTEGEPPTWLNQAPGQHSCPCVCHANMLIMPEIQCRKVSCAGSVPAPANELFWPLLHVLAMRTLHAELLT